MTQDLAPNVCPICENEIRDPLYRGPEGHSRLLGMDIFKPRAYRGPQVCYDCWVTWRIYPSDNYIAHALFMLAQGFTRAEVARRTGISRRTLGRRIKYFSK